jgi:A/G-specific adenine glycosylase
LFLENAMTGKAYLVPSPVRATIRRRLHAWFRGNARVLPWRCSRDPYAIWVSEVMLQQTQVATVVPYFRRFLEAFPTLRALAEATEQEVLRHWEGLGYYRRARDLLRAARTVVADHRGRFPRDPAVLGTLPGFGRYTVGAVLSQAFDSRLPILEANSQRVLCRLFGVHEDPRAPPMQRRLWRLAEELLPLKNVGQFNQALMELGALVCTPTAPACLSCPLAGFCAARRLGAEETIPARKARPQVELIAEVGVVVRRDNRVLLVQRPTTGRWANMWEFPHVPVEPHESPEGAAGRLLEEIGINARLGGEIMTLRHSVTRFRITLVCLEACYRDGCFGSRLYRTGRWLRPEQASAYPVSAPQRRLACDLAGT